MYTIYLIKIRNSFVKNTYFHQFRYKTILDNKVHLNTNKFSSDEITLIGLYEQYFISLQFIYISDVTVAFISKLINLKIF